MYLVYYYVEGIYFLYPKKYITSGACESEEFREEECFPPRRTIVSATNPIDNTVTHTTGWNCFRALPQN